MITDLIIILLEFAFQIFTKIFLNRELCQNPY